jgi:serine/threonine-protein kinase
MVCGLLYDLLEDSVEAHERSGDTMQVELFGEPDCDRRWVESRLGSQVGLSHRIVKHLASGGMGHVFLAEHIADGSQVAVKLAMPESDIPSQLLAHEAAMLSRVSHSNVVRLMESGRTFDGTAYLLLEYVSGLDLDDWMLRSKQLLRPSALLDVASQLAGAIDHLHELDLVHSDIKPANVMFDSARGAIKLVDFGLAFDRRDCRYRRGSAGTPGYMAPEQLRGEPCGPAIDRFALAALSFELLTGRALQPWATLSRVRAQAWARSNPWDHRALVGPSLQRVFARALHDEPAARYESAREFTAAFANALERDAGSEPARAGARATARLAGG